MSAETAENVPDRRKVRSKVTNGTRALLGIDGRSAIARRYRDLLELFTADLGGPDRLSEAQRQLVRRAATLSLELERIEAGAAMGTAIDLSAYSGASNTLRRLLATLGIKRAADRAPTLAEHLAARVQPTAEVAA